MRGLQRVFVVIRVKDKIERRKELEDIK